MTKLGSVSIIQIICLVGITWLPYSDVSIPHYQFNGEKKNESSSFKTKVR